MLKRADSAFRMASFVAHCLRSTVVHGWSSTAAIVAICSSDSSPDMVPRSHSADTRRRPGAVARVDALLVGCRITLMSYEQFRSRAREGHLVPVSEEILLDVTTPVAAFAALRRPPFAFLLESAP